MLVRKIWQGFVFASNYAPAGSLQQFLAKPLPQARALAIIRQVGEALQAAHKQGIVHGNLMPNNILFLQREAEIEAQDTAIMDEQPVTPAATDQVVITDFYLSSLAATQTFNTVNEHPQLRFYMAPEQFQGVRNALTDQYALAAIAYELFTGATPFAGSARTTLQHKHEDALPAAPDKLNPALSPAIAQAIVKALAKNPTERFPSVQDFLAAMESDHTAALNADPDVAVASTKKIKAALSRAPFINVRQSGRAARQPVRRKRLLLALLLLLLLLGASVFYVSGLYLPLLNGVLAARSTPTPTIASRSTTSTQQSRAGITATATQNNVRQPTPTNGVTPAITATSAPLPTATATTINVNLQVQPTPTPTPTPQAVATPTPTPNIISPPAPPGQGTVKPVLECVQLQGSSGYLAKFGYLNTSNSSITIPLGTDNMVVPMQYSSLLPTNFAPGRQYATIQINVSNNNPLVWMLDGSTATASPFSQRC
ncbi:hypothetical protein KDK_67180 [Dictyobacter kobayashii]|uniref:non-specific serine/threonine protein kinase n=1 Tax=Dictyobacter kobayashii TaxID=2014872 RepID=A0A402AUX3_9CHLR|nr:hypothetical protein KDK_67180 [Dictyobacter kobayashii]